MGISSKEFANLVTCYQMKHSASSNDSSVLEPPAFARDDSRMNDAASSMICIFDIQQT